MERETDMLMESAVGEKSIDERHVWHLTIIRDGVGGRPSEEAVSYDVSYV